MYFHDHSACIGKQAAALRKLAGREPEGGSSKKNDRLPVRADQVTCIPSGDGPSYQVAIAHQGIAIHDWR